MDLLSYAKDIAARVEAAATEARVPVTACVVDVHGNVVLLHRMQGAGLFAVEIAERKAYTSALIGRRTIELDPMTQLGQPLYPLLMMAGGRFTSMGGGVPLLHEGQRVAGVGVSGGTVEQDIAIVEAALAR